MTECGHMEQNEQREESVGKLRAAVVRELECGGDACGEELEQLLWSTLELFQDCEFHTSKNLQFTYSIKGNEMFVSRKDKSLTRATVALAMRTAVRRQQECGAVTGPKKLGTFGASYLYPVFIRIGVIHRVEA